MTWPWPWPRVLDTTLRIWPRTDWGSKWQYLTTMIMMMLFVSYCSKTTSSIGKLSAVEFVTFFDKFWSTQLSTVVTNTKQSIQNQFWMQEEILLSFLIPSITPSGLWHCWLGGRKSNWPVKTEWWGAGIVISLERGANDLHMVYLAPLPLHHLCFSKIQ